MVVRTFFLALPPPAAALAICSLVFFSFLGGCTEERSTISIHHSKVGRRGEGSAAHHVEEEKKRFHPHFCLYPDQIPQILNLAETQ